MNSCSDLINLFATVLSLAAHFHQINSYDPEVFFTTPASNKSSSSSLCVTDTLFLPLWLRIGQHREIICLCFSFKQLRCLHFSNLFSSLFTSYPVFFSITSFSSTILSSANCDNACISKKLSYCDFPEKMAKLPNNSHLQLLEGWPQLVIDAYQDTFSLSLISNTEGENKMKKIMA